MEIDIQEPRRARRAHQSKRQSVELMSNFRSSFQLILDPHEESRETAEALVSWMRREWGGLELYLSRSMTGASAAWMAGLLAELVRLRPEVTPAFLLSFQERITVIFGGMDLYITKRDPMAFQAKRQAIWDAWKAGATVDQMAIQFGHSSQWIRKIIDDRVKANRQASAEKSAIVSATKPRRIN